MTILDQTPTSDPLLFRIVAVNAPGLRVGLARVHEQVAGTYYEIAYLDGGSRAIVDASRLTVVDYSK